jgi:hypothetical protein
MKTTRTDSGFISRIILVIIALIAIKYYFHFDVIEWLKSDQGQKIFGPIIYYTKAFYNFLDNLVMGWTTK